MVGLGGIVGSLAAGLILSYSEGRYVFFFPGGLGFSIFVIGLFMPKWLEGEHTQTVSKMSLCERTKHNFREIW